MNGWSKLGKAVYARTKKGSTVMVTSYKDTSKGRVALCAARGKTFVMSRSNLVGLSRRKY